MNVNDEQLQQAILTLCNSFTGSSQTDESKLSLYYDILNSGTNPRILSGDHMRLMQNIRSKIQMKNYPQMDRLVDEFNQITNEKHRGYTIQALYILLELSSLKQARPLTTRSYGNRYGTSQATSRSVFSRTPSETSSIFTLNSGAIQPYRPLNPERAISVIQAPQSNVSILRDLIFSFQAVDGTNLKINKYKKAFEIVPTINVGNLDRSVIERLLHFGTLHFRIREMLQEMKEGTERGTVAREFVAAVEWLLKAVNKRVANLDSKLPLPAKGRSRNEGWDAFGRQLSLVGVTDGKEKLMDSQVTDRNDPRISLSHSPSQSSMASVFTTSTTTTTLPTSFPQSRSSVSFSSVFPMRTDSQQQQQQSHPHQPPPIFVPRLQLSSQPRIETPTSTAPSIDGSAMDVEPADELASTVTSSSSSSSSSSFYSQQLPGNRSPQNTMITYRSLLSLIAPQMKMLRVLYRVVSACQKESGTAILSTLHSQSTHGDPFVRQIVGTLLKVTSLPLWQFISRWVEEGVLEDTWDEFFIMKNEITPLPSHTMSGGFPHPQKSTSRLLSSSASASSLSASSSSSSLMHQGMLSGDEYWTKRFTLRRSKIPSFLSESMAEKILVIGKTINFLKEECGDNGWDYAIGIESEKGEGGRDGNEDYEEGGDGTGAGKRGQSFAEKRTNVVKYVDKSQAKESKQKSLFGSRVMDASLSSEERIDAIAAVVDGRLRNFILKRTNFNADLTALKGYLLLMRGDFVQSLMEAMWGRLDETVQVSSFTSSFTSSSATLSPSTASGSASLQLYSPSSSRSPFGSGASSSSNATQNVLTEILTTYLREDGETRGRVLPAELDARITNDGRFASLMGDGVSSGDRAVFGWNNFTLTYRVKKPCNAIITEQAMQKYLFAFDFLWTLKRVDFVLAKDWQKLSEMYRLSRNEMKDVKNYFSTLHGCSLLRNHMTLFIRNLEYYFMFEVLEASWIKLCHDLDKTTKMDDIIDAHNEFIDTIIERIKMGHSYSANAASTSSPSLQAHSPSSASMSHSFSTPQIPLITSNSMQSPSSPSLSAPTTVTARLSLLEIVKRLFTVIFRFDDTLGLIYKGSRRQIDLKQRKRALAAEKRKNESWMDVEDESDCEDEEDEQDLQIKEDYVIRLKQVRRDYDLLYDEMMRCVREIMDKQIEKVHLVPTFLQSLSTESIKDSWNDYVSQK
ncbi:gamma-tubulin complex component 3 [Monocercomonoides exilis]|uniref:gamma-tubulin complex component 3 n=1 Tax=Monocercomonoides exilis TaxID=2049356 RepID=UPI00355A89E2|nr:gamma-tubulin complex component 3 [Monocercomonoides exilis]|eukprot:MONOS_12229.1-p1 / transcript=MONOS_12229.1 / gene=MONOS_12229 / organism=Monocercomonoides_exilis_PA203 / gene_product=gamma-tubulin complex component 3 / transcript_product=gamma-tubulin complex component 3 / location=Mono_scaffold00662:25083-29005(+) / protein_length=1190 / sequence_SO=supercontig / SO=protein_coding / is_pseudo=false